MRGADVTQENMFSYLTLTDYVPEGHPLRAIREIVNAALREQLGYNMLFRWFVGLGVERKPWDHSTYTKNRDRPIEHEVVRELFERVLEQAKAKGLLSSEHFSVDGTLIRA